MTDPSPMNPLTSGRRPFAGHPYEYRVGLDLDHGVDLYQQRWPTDQPDTQWTWTYRYGSPARPGTGRKGVPAWVVEYRLRIRYHRGTLAVIPGATGVLGFGYPMLTMEIIRPPKRGKREWLGLDVSPGSKLTPSFEWVTDGEESGWPVLRLARIDLGTRIFDFASVGAGAVAPLVDFPFPIKDRIVAEGGHYHFPFLHEGPDDTGPEVEVDEHEGPTGVIEHFAVPVTLRREDR